MRQTDAASATEDKLGRGLKDKHRMPMGFNLDLNEIRCAREGRANVGTTGVTDAGEA